MDGIPMPEAITVTGTSFHNPVPLNASDVVDQFRIRQEIICDVFCAVRISGHQDRFCNCIDIAFNMRCFY